MCQVDPNLGHVCSPLRSAVQIDDGIAVFDKVFPNLACHSTCCGASCVTRELAI